MPICQPVSHDQYAQVRLERPWDTRRPADCLLPLCFWPSHRTGIVARAASSTAGCSGHHHSHHHHRHHLLGRGHRMMGCARPPRASRRLYLPRVVRWLRGDVRFGDVAHPIEMKGPAPGPVVRFLALVHISRRLHYISYAAPARAKREREPARRPPPRQVPRASASPEIDWPPGSLYRPSGTPASSRTRVGKRPFWNSIVEPFPASTLAAGRKGQARGSTVSVRARPARGPRETDATERGWSASMSMRI
jgi:hypothetical protein